MCFSLDCPTNPGFLSGGGIELVTLLSLMVVAVLCCFKKKKKTDPKEDSYRGAESSGTESEIRSHKRRRRVLEKKLRKRSEPHRRRKEHRRHSSGDSEENSRDESGEYICSTCRIKAEEVEEIKRQLKELTRVRTPTGARKEQKDKDRRQKNRKRPTKKKQGDMERRREKNKKYKGVKKQEINTGFGADQVHQAGIPVKFSASTIGWIPSLDSLGEEMPPKKLPEKAFGNEVVNRKPMRKQIDKIAASIQRLQQEQVEEKEKHSVHSEREGESEEWGKSVSCITGRDYGNSDF